MASFLGNLLEPFTGSSVQAAAKANQQWLMQQQAAEAERVNRARETGTTALQAGQTGALGALSGALGTARGDITGSTGPGLDWLTRFGELGENALYSGQRGGLGALYGGVNRAVGAYDPLATLSGYFGAQVDPYARAYAEATGAVPGGMERTLANLRATPGFKFAEETGTDAITRALNAAGGGNVLGGNLLRQVQEFGQNLAGTTYQDYLKNLLAPQQLYAPQLAQTGYQTAAGRAAPYMTGATTGANIYGQTGQQLADLYRYMGGQGLGTLTGQGTNLANLTAQLGGQLPAQAYLSTGQNIANLGQNLAQQEGTFAQNMFQPYTTAGMQYGTAPAQGAQNLFNLIGGATKLAGGFGWLPGTSYSSPWAASSTSIG